MLMYNDKISLNNILFPKNENLNFFLLLKDIS